MNPYDILKDMHVELGVMLDISIAVPLSELPVSREFVINEALKRCHSFTFDEVNLRANFIGLEGVLNDAGAEIVDKDVLNRVAPTTL